MSSPMARGSLENQADRVDERVASAADICLASLMPDLVRMVRSSGKKSRLNVENERGSELMAVFA